MTFKVEGHGHQSREKAQVAKVKYNSLRKSGDSAPGSDAPAKITIY